MLELFRIPAQDIEHGNGPQINRIPAQNIEHGNDPQNVQVPVVLPNRRVSFNSGGEHLVKDEEISEDESINSQAVRNVPENIKSNLLSTSNTTQ